MIQPLDQDLLDSRPVSLMGDILFLAAEKIQLFCERSFQSESTISSVRMLQNIAFNLNIDIFETCDKWCKHQIGRC